MPTYHFLRIAQASLGSIHKAVNATWKVVCAALMGTSEKLLASLRCLDVMRQDVISAGQTKEQLVGKPGELQAIIKKLIDGTYAHGVTQLLDDATQLCRFW